MVTWLEENCHLVSHMLFALLLQVYSGYRFLLRAAEREKKIMILNIGTTRADHLADLRVDARCGEVLPQLSVNWFASLNHWPSGNISLHFEKCLTFKIWLYVMFMLEDHIKFGVVRICYLKNMKGLLYCFFYEYARMAASNV